MITGVGVVALVVVTGSGYFFYQQHDKKLQSQAVNQFISGFETKDFETLGKSLREESVEKQGLTKETAIEKYDAIFNGLNITNIISSNTKVEDKSFSVTFNMTTPFGELKNQAYSGKRHHWWQQGPRGHRREGCADRPRHGRTGELPGRGQAGAGRFRRPDRA